MGKKRKTMALPRTKTMVQRAQAAERRILQNKQFMNPYEQGLCERLKAYYAQALTWMGDPMEQTGGIMFTDRNDTVHSAGSARVHRGIPSLQAYYVEMQREWSLPRHMNARSQMVRIFVFAVFEDGYKVGLRLDIPLMLMKPEAPQALVQCPPSGNLNALPCDPYADGCYLIMRCHPTLQCFVPAGSYNSGECSTRYTDDYGQV